MKTVRCFLAINLELKTATKISELQQELIEESAEYTTKFRWVPPQNMHVSVRFLGNITEPMIQAIKDNLEVTTRNAAPFQMQTGAVNVFDPEMPRVLYCAIEDPGGELNQLVSQVHEVLENTGFKETGKPYVPHVTLARLDKAEPAEIRQLIEKFDAALESTSLVRTLVCYQSDLQKSGADYRLLWKLPLKKRPQSKSYPPLEEPSKDVPEEQPAEESAETVDNTGTPNDADTANESSDDNNTSGPDNAGQGEQKQ